MGTVYLVMSKLVEFSSLSNLLHLCSDHFPGQLCRPGGINKDPTIWLDGARPPPRYISKNNISLTNWKIWPIRTWPTFYLYLSRPNLNMFIALTLIVRLGSTCAYTGANALSLKYDRVKNHKAFLSMFFTKKILGFSEKILKMVL